VLESERPPEALSRFPGFLMNYLGRQSGGRFWDRLRPYGLHPREFGVMTVIAANPGVTQQELGTLAGQDPSTMVALLDELERRGVAERRRNPADRRKYAIHLTPDGERLLAELQAVAREAGAEFFSRLDETEQAELLRLLRKLAGFDA
jgi:DNA-binding MarR family transcriptional regulator